ncbi:heterokaryon incompatibility protein-domain-containing protein [Staphylotrichum tortipilum]|uniref:Heterokaryon incompatibility protein-domain-containing protein n=1 Tax=Staphylotrichum tortipilum TaxID=2831512 RepID=A0AAN6RNV8_9PEZI|nr:heterokaryon incompatibility protein-domain-containing protein [Staphylotrichum longicolle]
MVLDPGEPWLDQAVMNEAKRTLNPHYLRDLERRERDRGYKVRPLCIIEEWKDNIPARDTNMRNEDINGVQALEDVVLDCWSQLDPGLGMEYPSEHWFWDGEGCTSRRIDRFRLLTLAPKNQTSDHLHYELLDHALDDARPYEALSYVWGSPDQSRALWCDGRTIPINQALYQALLHIQDVSLPRVLWIDHICINQSDLGERSKQVQMMRDIYARAARVLSWLGPDEANQAIQAKELIAQMALAMLMSPGPLERATPPCFLTDEQLAGVGLPLRSSAGWEAVESLLQNEYFQRIWILQEMKSGTDVLLMWGNTQIQWQDVCFAWGCATHKDRIFALIGLIDDPEPLRPDYTMTLGQTYATAFKHIIGSSQRLAALAYVWLRDLNRTDGTPTWAPKWDDLAARLDVPPHTLADLGRHAASGASHARWQEFEDWSILSLEGLVQDNVKAVDTARNTGVLDAEWDFLIESFQLALENTSDEATSATGFIKHCICTITSGHVLAGSRPRSRSS